MADQAATTGASHATTTRVPPRANPGLVLGALALAGLVSAVLQSLVVPALPAIARDLNASSGDVSWVLTAYLLSSAVTAPIAGRLGDMFGRRRTVLAVLALLVLGTLVSALANSMAGLVLGRVLQGASGGIMPLSIGIARDELPSEKVGVSVGLLSAIFGIGAVFGIVVGGPIVDHLSWHALFWLPFILAIVAVAGVGFFVPESAVRARGRIDFLGALLLLVGLVCLLLAIEKGSTWGWTGGGTVGLFVAAALALAAWFVVELRGNDPLVDLRMMTSRGVWTTNLVALAFGFAMYGSFVLIPLLLELPAGTGYGFGLSAGDVSVYLLPAALGMLVFAPLSGVLDRRFGARLPLVLGTVIAVAAAVVPAVAHSQTWEIGLTFLLLGSGLGLAWAAMANAIVAAVPASETSVATGMNSIMRQIGASIGTAIVGAILSSNVDAHGAPMNGAFTLGFWGIAIVLAVALLAALLVPDRASQPEEDTSSAAASAARRLA